MSKEGKFQLRVVPEGKDVDDVMQPRSIETDMIAAHNRAAWDLQVEKGNRATIPVDPSEIEATRQRGLFLSLTDSRCVPQSWIADVAGKEVLCLGCGGGQQVPLLGAAGARVTSLDNSPRQLDHDRAVGEAHGIEIRCILGDFRNLEMLRDSVFDYVILGLALQFVPNPTQVWVEASRVLRPGGHLIGAIVNPHCYVLDWQAYQAGELTLRHSLPYSDLSSISEQERTDLFAGDDPIEFGHTLEALLGGLTQHGFLMRGFFEDIAKEELTAQYFATYYVFKCSRERTETG